MAWQIKSNFSINKQNFKSHVTVLTILEAFKLTESNMIFKPNMIKSHDQKPKKGNFLILQILSLVVFFTKKNYNTSCLNKVKYNYSEIYVGAIIYIIALQFYRNDFDSY